MIYKKSSALIVALFVLLVSACAAENPVKIAQSEKITSQAEQAAADAELAREIERENQDHELARRAYWSMIWQSAAYTTKVVANVTVVSLGMLTVFTVAAAAFIVWDVRKGVQTMIFVRTSIVPVSKSGARPQFLFREELPLPRADQNAGTALGFTRAFQPRPHKWILVDSASGERAYIDDRQKANTVALEIYRQVILNKQRLEHQNKSAKYSPDGAVADVMDTNIPGANLIELDGLSAEFIQNTIQGMQGMQK